MVLVFEEQKTSKERAMFSNSQVSGCGSVWLEYLVWDQGVAGSNPVTPICFLKNIIYESVAQLDRASAF